MPFENKDDAFSTEERDLGLKKNRIIRKSLPRLSKKIGRRGGPVKKFTPIRMRNAVNRYFSKCEKDDEMPTIKGLMIFLDMSQSMFYSYLSYPEFTDIMEHTRLIISHWAEMDVYHHEGRSEGKIAYMKNIHGWTDKMETKNENTNVQLTVDQARMRIEQLAPKLLEVLRGADAVNQIAKSDKVVEAEVIEENPRRV